MTRTEESAVESGARAISQPSAHVSAGYLRRLWRGEVALPVTYWLWGVLVNLLLRLLVLIVALVTNSLSVVRGLVLLYLAFNLFMCVAIWRSAGLYTGRRIWGDLARVSLLLVLIVRLARVFLGE